MTLIAEQVKYLRERKKLLVERYNSYQHYLSNGRELESINESTPFFADYEENLQHQKDYVEIHAIEKLLGSQPIKVERDFDKIDCGTAFYAVFDGDSAAERITLVESNAAIGRMDAKFVSLDSDFGKAVKGHTDGDRVVYTVQSTGRKLGVNVLQIDRIQSHYAHFIRERNENNRYSRVAKRELRELKENNPVEYANRHRLTPSQVEIVREELERGGLTTSRETYLNRLVDSAVASKPEKNTVGIGSFVAIRLIDETGEEDVQYFELINKAVSYEIEGDYVERISPLGSVIFGLHVGDTFSVPRSGKPSLHGEILLVDNEKCTEFSRVR